MNDGAHGVRFGRRSARCAHTCVRVRVRVRVRVFVYNMMFVKEEHSRPEGASDTTIYVALHLCPLDRRRLQNTSSLHY